MMAYRLYGPLDMNKHEIRNARFHYLAQPPASAMPGQYYWDTTLGQLRIMTAHGWQNATVGKWEGSRQLQGGVPQEIEHGLGTDHVVCSFLVEEDIEDDPSTSGQDTIKRNAQLDWWVIDQDRIGLQTYGMFPNTTFWITIVG